MASKKPNWTIEDLAHKWRIKPTTVLGLIDRGLFTLERSSVAAFVATEQGKRLTLRAIRFDAKDSIGSLISAAGEDCGPRADIEPDIHALLWPGRTSVLTGAQR